MPDEVLVKCENVSKKFCRSLKRSLWYGVQDICSELNPLRGERDIDGTEHFPKLRKDEFWAVNDVSFELKRGECIGLIGHNGAGKSTLLKMLNGLIKPDHGRITMKGRIGALIELNAGFNPILTGRENVYIYGSILGFTKKEIDQKYDDIVEFAELADFMTMPFRSYSSGMKVRLGFAVAAQMEPDVLIIDEVLAVGDIGFKIKCLNVMSRLITKCAVIFVSHNMANIAKVSTDILLLKASRNIYHGKDTSKGIFQYFEQFNFDAGVRIGEDKILLKSCGVHGKDCSEGVVKYNEDLFVDIEFIFAQECRTDLLMLTFVDKEAKNVAVTYLKLPEKMQGGPGIKNLTVKIPHNPFSAGIFSVTIMFAESINECLNGRIVAQYQSAVSFRAIESKTITNIPVQLESEIVTN